MTTSDQLGDAVASAFGRVPERLLERDVKDFRRIGFQAELAEKAARALAAGTYGSFEEAAAMCAAFDQAPGNRASRVDARVLEAVKRERRGAEAIQERAMPQAGRPLVREAAAARVGASGLLEAQLISAGQGSSGFYSADVLKAAAADRVFPAGLHVYVDHPTESEAYERPERSVRDLAGVLESDARFVSDALHASVKLFDVHKELILERADSIGMSIRASAEVSESGARGREVTRLVSAESVDFVTQAGRGGRILSIR